MYTACYKWHDITINEMKYNLVRIMHDMRIEKWEKIWYECKTIARLYLIMLKMEKYWALCVLMHLGIPLFHHDGYGYDRYILQNPAGRGTIIMFYIMLPVGYAHYVLG